MIKTIKDKANQIDLYDNDAFIEFFEDNELFFANYNLFSETNDIIDIILMKSHYIKALISKKRYTKALKFIKNVDELLEKIKDKSEQYDNLKMQNTISKGVSLGNLKKFKQSYEIFNDLITKDPENDMFKIWYIQMKTYLIHSYLNFAGYTGIGILAADLILSTFFNFSFDKSFTYIAFILIAIWFAIPYAMKFFIKKKVSKEK